ncbi:MAG TPA: DUF3187 family protein [Steroidobacter sp.]|nr:DUF3187 family protein [Steroidobacteraceae bacterium]HLS81468.1 DUF3187 family protein [Steroidobacter sp.]
MNAALLGALVSVAAGAAACGAQAQEVTELVRDENGRRTVVEQRWSHVGLLRARDLTPFGLLRLDMLPAHTADAEVGVWTYELQLAYQSTYIMSRNVRGYLASRGDGRQAITERDANAILDLPGDAYLFDGEIGLVDIIVQRRISDYWSIYLSIPYLHYGEGVFDQLIEDFHDTFGFSQQGRTLVPRNRFHIIYDVGGVQFAQLGRSVRGGWGDPVIGVRYSLPQPHFGWDVVAELAAKIAVDGERFLLSTGEHDIGAQLTLQRRLGAEGRHAIYLAGSAVYYAGGPEIPGDETEIIPTLIAGYSYGLTPRTSLIVQGYASPSVVQHSSLDELTDDKFQVSLGVQTRTQNWLWSFAVTENVSNLSNTPDIGVQLGAAYMPKAK